jgi:tRNA (Thr-GGU) A37 N-methylase
VHPIYPLDEEGNIKIRSIGYVRSSTRHQQTGGFLDSECQIVLDPELEPLLRGIEEFSHVVVLCWLHEITTYASQRRPQGRDDVPAVGILASR